MPAAASCWNWSGRMISLWVRHSEAGRETHATLPLVRRGVLHTLKGQDVAVSVLGPSPRSGL